MNIAGTANLSKLRNVASKCSLRYLENSPVSDKLNVEDNINKIGYNWFGITPPLIPLSLGAPHTK